jgi:hypothetical protein
MLPNAAVAVLALRVHSAEIRLIQFTLAFPIDVRWRGVV